jgi:hypothetical protein
MKISPITILRFNKINTKIQRINNTKLQPLKKDTVSFGHFIPTEVPDDIQLYRCIGKEEYQKLVNGETVFSSGYATSDPKGWEARGWNDGFIPSGSNSEQYFITFKTDRSFDVTDERQFENETRYRIMDEYSLDDIENIRKGRNVHGELVWAENFEEEKKKDIEHKKSEISKLIAKIEKGCENSERKNIIDELASYVKEFPEIVELFEKFVDYNNEEDINDLNYLISKSDSDKFLSQYRRKCLNSIEDGVVSNSNFYNYLIDNNNIDTVIKELNDDNIDNLIVLSEYIYSVDKDGKYSDIIKNILNKAYSFCENLQENDDETENKINYILDPCIEYLEKFDNNASTDTLESFCQDDT